MGMAERMYVLVRSINMGARFGVSEGVMSSA
jgi:hypothetical protein